MAAKQVGFWKAPVLFFKGYFDFKGRSGRGEYWWMAAWELILVFGLLLGAEMVSSVGLLKLFLNSYSMFADSGLYSILQVAIEVAQLYVFICALKPSAVVSQQKHDASAQHA